MVLTIVTMTQGWFVAQTWYDASSTIVFLVNRREVEIMIIVIAPLLINPFEYLSKWVLPQANLCNIVFYDEMDGYTKNVNPHVMFMRYVLGENSFYAHCTGEDSTEGVVRVPLLQRIPLLLWPFPSLLLTWSIITPRLGIQLLENICICPVLSTILHIDLSWNISLLLYRLYDTHCKGQREIRVPWIPSKSILCPLRPWESITKAFNPQLTNKLCTTSALCIGPFFFHAVLISKRVVGKGLKRSSLRSATIPIRLHLP